MISRKNLKVLSIDLDAGQSLLLLPEPSAENRLVRVQAAVPRHLPSGRAGPAAAGRLAGRDCEALVGRHVGRSPSVNGPLSPLGFAIFRKNSPDLKSRNESPLDADDSMLCF